MGDKMLPNPEMSFFFNDIRNLSGGGNATGGHRSLAPKSSLVPERISVRTANPIQGDGKPVAQASCRPRNRTDAARRWPQQRTSSRDRCQWPGRRPTMRACGCWWQISARGVAVRTSLCIVAELDASFVKRILWVLTRRRETDIHHHRQADQLVSCLKSIEGAEPGHRGPLVRGSPAAYLASLTVSADCARRQAPAAVPPYPMPEISASHPEDAASRSFHGLAHRAQELVDLLQGIVMADRNANAILHSERPKHVAAVMVVLADVHADAALSQMLDQLG